MARRINELSVFFKMIREQNIEPSIDAITKGHIKLKFEL